MDQLRQGSGKATFKLEKMVWADGETKLDIPAW